MIPKIIHQTAPRNRKKWPFIWKRCSKSWKDNFSMKEYKHILWDDDDNYNLVKNYYPKYFKLYNSFPYNILRIDFVRFCYLHKFGGIYADMDMYCNKNFYSEISKSNEIHLLESYAIGEKVQNSLMASPPNHSFWIFVMDSILSLAENIDYDWNSLIEDIKYDHSLFEFRNPDKFNAWISNTSGPLFLSNILANTQFQITLFKVNLYNTPDIIAFNGFKHTFKESKDRFYYLLQQNSQVYTMHFLSGMWGLDIQKLNELTKSSRKK